MIVDATTLTYQQLLEAYQVRERRFQAQLVERDRFISEQQQRIARHEQTIVSHEQTIVSHEQTIVSHEQAIVNHQQQIATYEQTLAQKQFHIAKLEQMLFGSKRERFTVPDGQQVLPFLVDSERVATAVEQERAKIKLEYSRTAGRKHPGRLPLPEHLPVEEIVLEPGVDTTGLKCIGQEITEELGYVPPRFCIRRYIRRKFVTPEADDQTQQVLIAPLPSRPIDKCEAGADLLAAMVIDKHVYHLPIYRQIERFSRMGMRLPSSTADSWQRLTGLLLRPLYATIGELLKQANYLQVDESGLPVLDRSKPGKTHRGYLWAYHAPVDGFVYFDYQPGRGKVNCQQLLENYTGYLQTDGYAAYDAHKARDGVIPVACWAHVRRKFFDAQNNDRVRAEEALSLIQLLYDVEGDARQQQLGPEERKELRLDKSLPITNVFGQWLVRSLDATTPKSPIGNAVRYAVSLWSELQTYLIDGALEIDNNLVENAIRPLALGRKNYLFAGSHDAAVNIAMYRTFFGTCRLHGVDEYRWLTHVLSTIRSTPAADYHKLLPQHVRLQPPG